MTSFNPSQWIGINKLYPESPPLEVRKEREHLTVSLEFRQRIASTVLFGNIRRLGLDKQLLTYLRIVLGVLRAVPSPLEAFFAITMSSSSLTHVTRDRRRICLVHRAKVTRDRTYGRFSTVQYY
jgi:hypothetical protein